MKKPFVNFVVYHVLMEPEPDLSLLVESSQLHAILRYCAEHLSDTLKQVFRLFIKDHPQHEIAEQLAIKLGNVKSRTSEMIRKLGECVRKQNGCLGG